DYDGAPKDGSAWVSNCDGNYRVLRGSDWFNNPRFLRSANRFRDEASDRNNGFRVARTLTPLTPLEITSPSDDTRYKLGTADATPQMVVVVVEGSNADDALTMNLELSSGGASVVSVPTSLSFPEDIGNIQRELRFQLTTVAEGDETVTIVVADSLGNTDELDIYVEVGERGSTPGTFRDCSNCPQMVRVPSGSFLMGSPEDEPDRYSDEGPQHRVTIPQPFAVGKYEVTRGQFEAFVNATGYDAGVDWRHPGFNAHPVVYVSWHDAQAYVDWLTRSTGKSYRLLSEAEWEYVARAGTTTAYHFGNTINPSQANYDYGQYNQGTVAVGHYPANAFGLHDVHGNVWEWVEDCSHDDYDGAPADGSAWVSSCRYRYSREFRVLRGGSWNESPRFLRSAYRGGNVASDRVSNVGFRVARTLTP
ncbi:MAG: SUMF1/EgtB/PvdO family nonheme iron enzyme, partial [Chromatiales bacterium]|nr:SUMF1/EgtB/PvdO family nonheme iron enzyme [Chromatiales bacterium]